MKLRSVLSFPGVRVAIALYATVSFAFTQIPLLNALGYESSFGTALLGSLVAGLTTARRLRRAVYDDGNLSWSVGGILLLFRECVAVNMLLLLVPLAVLSLNALFVRNCSLAEGLVFFLLLPAVSVWFASSLGMFCAVHYRRSRTIFVLMLLASLGYALALGYFTPAIFSYNFFYGFFPGLSYDEILRISAPLILFRLLTAALGGVLVWWGTLIVRSSGAGQSASVKGLALLRSLVAPGNRTPFACVVGVLVFLYVLRCDIGWEATASYIQSRLGSKYETPHVVLYYSREDISTSDVQRMAGEHEFRIAQLQGDLGLTEVSRIESYLYPGNEIKRRLIGTGTTNIAKPWSNQIHLTRQSVESTLKHELAHVLVGRYGLPIIRASLSTGLVEGLATALDGVWGNRTLHQYAAAMKKFDRIPDIRRLMSFSGFAAQNSAVSYVAAGSFCRYLIDAYGMPRVLAVYRSGDYRGVYSRSLSELIEEWNRFLTRIRVSDGERDAIDVLFREPSIFRKTCARVVAGWNDEARVALALRRYAVARTLYQRSFDEAGGYEPLAGLVFSTIRLGDYRTVERITDSLVLQHARPAQFLPLFVWCGDARWADGDTAGARVLYERVRGADIADNLTEAAAVRLGVLGAYGECGWLLPYFLSDDPDSARCVRLDSLLKSHPEGGTFVRYLQGRVMARMGNAAGALAALDSLDLFPVSRELEAVRRKTVALQQYSLGRYDLARETFWMSMNVVATEAAVVEAREWATRCTWMARHGF
jgi:hypothetical protein